MTDMLNRIEQIALYGLMARKREALGPILADEHSLVQEIELRLQLPAGAIGTTHRMLDDEGGLRVEPVDTDGVE